MQFSAGGKREPFAFIGRLKERRKNPKNKRKKIVEISKQLVSRSYSRHRNKFTAGILVP
jgi:hypothetical protein